MIYYNAAVKPNHFRFDRSCGKIEM